MKFLHLADLHIGKLVHNYSMVADQKDAFEQVFRYVDEEQPDGVILAGDIYDRSVPAVEAVSLFDEFLTRLVEKNLKIFIISGNHDSAGRLQFGKNILKGSQVFLEGTFQGTLSKIELQDKFGPFYVYLLPFVKPADVRAAYRGSVSEEELEKIKNYNQSVAFILSHTSIDSSVRNLLVAHQFITGSKTSESEDIIVGGLDNVDASVFQAFDYVALGHLHSPQKVTRDTIRYAGTLIPYSFSEKADEKSITVIEFGEGKSPRIRQLPIHPLHEMIQVEGMLEELLKSEPTDAYVKAIVTDKKAVVDAVLKLRSQVFKNLMTVEFSNLEKEQKMSIENAKMMLQADPVSLFETFYKEQNGEEISKEERERIIQIYDEVRG